MGHHSIRRKPLYPEEVLEDRPVRFKLHPGAVSVQVSPCLDGLQVSKRWAYEESRLAVLASQPPVSVYLVQGRSPKEPSRAYCGRV